MRAAVVDDVNRLCIDDVELAEPGADEVLVRVVATGVCHTDLTVLRGAFPVPTPIVLGHEGAGVVEAVGPGVTGLQAGDKVVLSITIPCGTCFQCLVGAPGLCETSTASSRAGVMLDGTSRLSRAGQALHHMFCQSSLAERAVVPAAAAVKVRDDAPLPTVALLGCGAMTGVGAVMNRAGVRPGESVLVLGVGGVGLSAVLAARTSGAHPIIALDRSRAALEFASRLGATHVIGGGDEPAEMVRSIVPRGVDHAFDAAGAGGTLETCLRAVRAGGRVVAIGMSSRDQVANVEVYSLLFEKTVTGTRAGSITPHVDIPRCVELCMNGSLPLDELIVAEYDLDGLPDALDHLASGGVGRGVVRFPVDR